MAISADDAIRLALAARLSGEFPSSVMDTGETRAYFADLKSETIPEGATEYFPNEWEDDDKYAALIAASGNGWDDEDYADEVAAEADQEDGNFSLITKADGERRFTLGPMYVPNQLDAHNEWTDPDELQTALWDYVKSNDRRIRLQHNRDVVAGEWVEAMTIPFPVEVPMMKSDGTHTTTNFPANTVFMGVIWEPWAWNLVKAGKLRGYSIGGKAERVLVDLADSEAPTGFVEKSSFSNGDMVSWSSSGGNAMGKIERVMREGTLDVPNSSF
jgi:hypothetical protein